MYYDQKESGKRIAALRKEKGMTQEQLAEKLNIVKIERLYKEPIPQRLLDTEQAGIELINSDECFVRLINYVLYCDLVKFLRKIKAQVVKNVMVCTSRFVMV